MLVADGHYLEHNTGTTRLVSLVNRFRIGDPTDVYSSRHMQPGRAPQRSHAGKKKTRAGYGVTDCAN